MKVYEIFKPDKVLFNLTASLEGFGGSSSSYQVHVNFIKYSFIYLEWRNHDTIQPFSDVQSAKPGSFENFKREIYSLRLWEWSPIYRKEDGIILDGKYWSVKLITKGKVYISSGTDSFPPNWDLFCKAVERLTGTAFR